MAKKQIKVWLEQSQIDELKPLCNETKLERSHVIRIILSDYLKVFKLNKLQNG